MAASPPARQVTSLLEAWNQGDERALQQIMPVVYEELRRVASRYMAGERASHTLQTTALVHEVYTRLVDIKSASIRNRAHFLALCARLMRNVLVDFARSRRYDKRGGGAVHVELDEALHLSPAPDPDLVALDETLGKGLAVARAPTPGRLMDADSWRRIDDLYHAAARLPAGERSRFVDDACGGDLVLRAEVESLLAYERSADAFIEAPAMEVAGSRRRTSTTPRSGGAGTDGRGA